MNPDEATIPVIILSARTNHSRCGTYAQHESALGRLPYFIYRILCLRTYRMHHWRRFIDCVYIACIVTEVILHFRLEIDWSDKKKIIISDLLQLPVSFLFTRLMDLLSHHIPDYSGLLLYRIPLLFLAILFVGTSAAMTLDMRLIANPADGIVQVISDVSGLQLGLTKRHIFVTHKHADLL